MFFAHTAGLRVVACADPAEAYSMIQLAIASEDPVIFLEPKRRYWEKAEVERLADRERLGRHQCSPPSKPAWYAANSSRCWASGGVCSA